MKLNDSLKKNLPYLILLVIVLAAVTFFGIKFFKKENNNQNQASNTSGPNGNNRFGGRNGSNGFNRDNFTPITGTINNISGDIIVMSASDGTTKNITTTSSTKIMEEVSGQRTQMQLSDLKVNDKINVMTSDTGSNNITAQMIFIGDFTPPQNGNFNQNSNESYPQSSS